MLCFLARSFAIIARSAGISDFDSISAGNSYTNLTINVIKFRLILALSFYSQLI